MQNLKIHSYQPAPVAITSSSPGQKGGRGYHHKRGCKCPLCKRGGGNSGLTDSKYTIDFFNEFDINYNSFEDLELLHKKNGIYN